MAKFVMRGGRRIEVETVELPGKPTRRRTPGTFAQVPLAWAAKAAKATNTLRSVVWIELLYAAWQAKSDTVTLSSARLGVSPHTKLRALRKLEAAGLVKVTWRGRKAPLVFIERQSNA